MAGEKSKSIKIGSTVRLKSMGGSSQGPVMTVTSVRFSGIRCTWFHPDTKRFEEYIFPLGALNKV